MLPILLRFGDQVVFTYPIILSFAFFTGLGLWLRETHRMHPALASDKLVNAALLAFFGGLAGARVLFILVQWPRYASGRLHVWALWEGGLVFLGGLIAAIGILWFRLPRLGFATRREGFESLAAPVAFAHAVGRLACFANGCCHGSTCPYPWGVTYTDPYSAARPLGTPLHPTQLYEAGALVALGTLLLWNGRRPERRFSNVALYLGIYGVFRFGNEFFRGDLLRGEAGGLSTSQWISLALVATAVFLDLRKGRGHKTSP